MAVGFPTKVNYATGDVLSATNMNDLSGTVNLLESAQYAAGKNKIINGDFGVWQRGTSFSSPATGAYTSDRWTQSFDGTGATRTISQQSFSLGAAPVAGYEGTFFYRYAQSVAGSGGSFNNILQQRIEDVRQLAGQTVTVSYWAKADATRSIIVGLGQVFGQTGSPSSTVYTSAASVNLTTSWVRYSATLVLPSISGKTITTNSNLELYISTTANTTFTIDFWGVQVEAASSASNFQTATGTKQGELAACQRYFQKTNNQTEAPGTAPSITPINALNASSTLVVGIPPFKVNMRTSPTVVLYSAATGTSGKIRSGGADVTATAADVGEYSIGYISATGLVSGSNSTVTFTASAEL